MKKATLKCVSSNPILGGMRYGFRAIEDPSISPEDSAGGVSLEVVIPLAKDKDSTPYSPGDVVTIQITAKKSADELAEARVIDPVSTDRQTFAPVVTAEGSLGTAEGSKPSKPTK